MINREMKTVSVYTYNKTTDKYGCLKTGTPAIRKVKMMCKIYSQTGVDGPVYNEVEMIGLTKDFNITDENQILIDSTKYQILHTIPSGRYLQVLMRKL